MVYTIAQTLNGNRNNEGQTAEDLTIYDVFEFQVEHSGTAKMDAFGAMAMEPLNELGFNWIEAMKLNRFIKG